MSSYYFIRKFIRFYVKAYYIGNIVFKMTSYTRLDDRTSSVNNADGFVAKNIVLLLLRNRIERRK